MDATAEVALLVEAVATLVIEPTFAKKWKGVDAKVSAALTTNGGIGKHNGKWSMVCESCGWNTTHITGYRDKWVADPKSFSLPVPHLFWSKSGKNSPEGGSGGSMTPTAAPTTTAASITFDRSLSLCVGPLIACTRPIPRTGNLLPSLLISKGR